MLSHVVRGAVSLAVALTFAPLVLAAPAEAGQKIRPAFFGMHARDWTEPPGVRVGSANFTTTATYWSHLQPTEGVPVDFTRLDEQVDAARARGMRPMVLIGGTPSWAVDPTLRRDGFRDQAQVPLTAAFRTYTEQLVRRYGTRLDYQVWPEPNVSHNWVGGAERMARLIMIASKVIRREAPGATVVSGAAVLRLRNQQTWFIKFLRATPGNRPTAHWVDALAVDGYPIESGTPESAMALLRWARSLRVYQRAPKPLWNNEVNFGVPVGGASPSTTIDPYVGASWVSRALVLNAHAGVGRFYWLGWLPPRPNLGISMMDDTGAPTPAATAFRVTRHWLVRTRMEGCLTRKRLRTCTVTTPTQVRRILWRTSGRSFYRTPASTRYTQTIMGHKNLAPGPRRVRITTRPLMVSSRR